MNSHRLSRKFNELAPPLSPPMLERAAYQRAPAFRKGQNMRFRRKAENLLTSPHCFAPQIRSIILAKHEAFEMFWFRFHPRFCSWVALFALAIQLVLSFGHIHLDDVRGQSA